MNMMQSRPVESFDRTDRGAGSHRAVGPVFRFDADANTSDGIVSQKAAVDLDVLASALVAAFRAHSHINNVMTHISGARWDDIERALHVILDPSTVPDGLSRLEENIVGLLCAERGVTGRVFKPYFETLLARLLPPTFAAQLQDHLLSLHAADQSAAGTDSHSAPIFGATGAVR